MAAAALTPDPEIRIWDNNFLLINADGEANGSTNIVDATGNNRPYCCWGNIAVDTNDFNTERRALRFSRVTYARIETFDENGYRRLYYGVLD